jgi:hypothetical protein
MNLIGKVEGLLQNTPEKEALPARREVIPFPSTFLRRIRYGTTP